MQWRRRLLPFLGIVLPSALAVGGAGLLAHREALAVRLEAEPADEAGRARLRLTVRNRILSFVPVRGAGFSPAFRLETKVGGRWEAVQTMESETEETWLFPYQRCRFPLTVDETGAYRAAVITGRGRTRSHYSLPVKVEVRGAQAALAPDEPLPLTH